MLKFYLIENPFTVLFNLGLTGEDGNLESKLHLYNE